MLIIECQNDKLVFAPDVQGPIDQNALKIIMDEKPQLLIIGGPPLYLEGFKVDEAQIQTALANMERIAATVPSVILEHHLLRDENWRGKTKIVFDKAKKTGGSILTAAEFLGEHDRCLEAARNRLFAEFPPSSEFKKWMRLDEEAKKREKPPL
jgi:predicted metallo-beta-lactamase superfamily hydrolase